MIKRLFLGALLAFSMMVPAYAAKDAVPMSQGLHEWQTSSGKLILVVGSYQDVTSFHRSYSFYFKANGDQDWNQVPLMRKNSGMEFTWDSASGGDVLLADAIVVPRKEGLLPYGFGVKGTPSLHRGPCGWGSGLLEVGG